MSEQKESMFLSNYSKAQRLEQHELVRELSDEDFLKYLDARFPNAPLIKVTNCFEHGREVPQSVQEELLFAMRRYVGQEGKNTLRLDTFLLGTGNFRKQVLDGTKEMVYRALLQVDVGHQVLEQSDEFESLKKMMLGKQPEEFESLRYLQDCYTLNMAELPLTARCELIMYELFDDPEDWPATPESMRDLYTKWKKGLNKTR
mgnify:CR=1 FL=1